MLNYEPSLRQQGRTYRQLLEIAKLVSSVKIDVIYVCKDVDYVSDMLALILAPCNAIWTNEWYILVGSSSIRMVTDNEFNVFGKRKSREQKYTIFVDQRC